MPTTTAHSRDSARAVDLGDASVHLRGPKFQIKHKSRCLQKSKLVNWVTKHVDSGGQAPLALLGAGPGSFQCFINLKLKSALSQCLMHKLGTSRNHHNYQEQIEKYYTKRSIREIFLNGKLYISIKKCPCATLCISCRSTKGFN